MKLKTVAELNEMKLIPIGVYAETLYENGLMDEFFKVQEIIEAKKAASLNKFKAIVAAHKAEKS